MAEQATKGPQISVTALRGINLRASRNTLSSGESDRCFGLFPKQTGQLSRMPGKTPWRVFDGRAVTGCEQQTFNSTVIIQNGDAINVETIDSLRNRQTATPSFTPTYAEEENYGIAVILHREATTVNGGDASGKLTATGIGAANTFYPRRLTALAVNEASVITGAPVASFTAATATDGAATFTSTSASPTVVTWSSSTGLSDGAPVVLSGTLPAEITAGALYYWHVVSGTTGHLYDTAAHAIAGGATGRVNTTGTGSGVITNPGIFTLAAGTYRVRMDATYHLSQTGAPTLIFGLYNATDLAFQTDATSAPIIGEVGSTSSGFIVNMTNAFSLEGCFTITGTKVFYLAHKVSYATGGVNGVDPGFCGTPTGITASIVNGAAPKNTYAAIYILQTA